MREEAEPQRRTIGFYIHVGDATEFRDVEVCTVAATSSGHITMTGFDADLDITGFFREVTLEGLQEMVEAITGRKVA